MAGQFIWSVTATDIYSQWTEIQAMFHEGKPGALEAVKSIEKVPPFALIAFDSDNGGEFLNYYLVEYFVKRDTVLSFTRSREYKKNDNAHVEQKNYTHVRQLLGYGRPDNIEILDPLNLILRDWSTLRKHFYPLRKLLAKERIGSRYHKRYDKPRTPYQRLLESPAVDQAVKDTLKQIHQTLDPLLLRRSIRKRPHQLLRFSSVTSFSEESNRLTA